MLFSKRVAPGTDATDTRLHRANATVSRYVVTGMSALWGLASLPAAFVPTVRPLWLLTAVSFFAAAVIAWRTPWRVPRVGGRPDRATALRGMRNVALIIALWCLPTVLRAAISGS